jgi:hypothetical protein
MTLYAGHKGFGSIEHQPCRPTRLVRDKRQKNLDVAIFLPPESPSHHWIKNAQAVRLNAQGGSDLTTIVKRILRSGGDRQETVFIDPRGTGFGFKKCVFLPIRDVLYVDADILSVDARTALIVRQAFPVLTEPQFGT